MITCTLHSTATCKSMYLCHSLANCHWSKCRKSRETLMNAANKS